MLALVPQLENMVGAGKKKFVRYAEGASLYSLGLHTFQEIAKEANAVYKVKRCVLVNTEKVDEYLENFCECHFYFYSQLYSQHVIIILVGNKSWVKEHTNGY